MSFLSLKHLVQIYGAFPFFILYGVAMLHDSIDIKIL